MAVSFRESMATFIIACFGPVRKIQRSLSAPNLLAYAFKTEGVSKSGSVVSVTNLAWLFGGRDSCKSFIWRLIFRHGPAHRVKMTSATQTRPRKLAKET